MIIYFDFQSQFSLFYDLDNITRPTSISYVGSSVTTYSYLNPGYRIYTVDGFYQNSSWQILDYDQRFLNLTEANLLNVTNWRPEYSAKVIKTPKFGFGLKWKYIDFHY